MQTLANYFDNLMYLSKVVRFWYKENESDVCDFKYINEVLTDTAGDVIGLVLIESLNSTYGEFRDINDIAGWAVSEGDQDKVIDEVN
jgi:hypothetical protein